MGGGTGGVMVKTHALDLESQGLSPTTVWAFFSFPLFNLNALESTQLYEEVFHRILWRGRKAVGLGGPGSYYSPKGLIKEKTRHNIILLNYVNGYT